MLTRDGRPQGPSALGNSGLGGAHGAVGPGRRRRPRRRQRHGYSPTGSEDDDAALRSDEHHEARSGAGVQGRLSRAIILDPVSTETTVSGVASRGRLMAALFSAQVCGSTGHSIAMAVGSIMAASIMGTNTWSGVPIAVGALGTAFASWPLARLMDRSGRRPGLVLGYGLAMVGAVLGIVGVTVGSFVLLLVGMALFGIAQTSNLLSRYAAADVSPGAQRGRAMGLIVWGSTAGSIIGPNLMEPALRAGGAVGVSPAASAFLISVGGYALAALLVELLLRPDPLTVARQLHELIEPRRPVERARPLGVILGDLRVQLALATLTISQFVMISTTSTSPVYLHDQGYHVQTIGLAVSLHLAGMYVASPLSGWLCDRFGRLSIIALGALVLIGAVIVAGVAPRRDRGLVILRVFFQRGGWDLAFVVG